jgi:hypothetical protein
MAKGSGAGFAACPFLFLRRNPPMNPMNPMNTELLDRFLEDRTTPIARDLKLNLKKFVTEGALEPTDALLALVATATSVGSEELAGFA